MRRRALLSSLSGVLAAALAGCPQPERDRETYAGVPSEPVATLSMTPVTDAEVARRLAYTLTRRHRRDERRFVDLVLAAGPVTVTATSPPVPADTPVLHDGTVYEFAHEASDQFSARSFRVGLSAIDGPVDGGNAMRYDSLPAVDRATLRRYGWTEGGPFGLARGTAVYRERVVERSRLVPTPDRRVLTWDTGSPARVGVWSPSATEARSYTYTATTRGTAATVGAALRERHVFELTGLSERQRDLVSTAIERDAGYEVDEGEPSDAFLELVERFAGEPKLRPWPRESAGERTATTRGRHTGSYLVRHRGEVYWTGLTLRQPSTDDAAG